jgi:thiol-disulfide isomerase/thioredoxin
MSEHLKVPPPVAGRRRSRHVWLLLVVAALGATYGCTLGSASMDGRHPSGVQVHVVPAGQRSRLANLSGTTLSGSSFDLADHLGRSPVLINVWASWCEPCRREMPILARAASRHPAALAVLGIDERDSDASARTFSSSMGATYPSLVDRDSRLLLKLPMVPHNAIPSSVLLDGDGGVAGWVVGPVTSHELASLISRIRVTS